MGKGHRNVLVSFRSFLYPISMGLLNSIWKELISLEIFLPFIPLFVAFDALGILPIFVSLTSEMETPERKRVIRQSTLTAFLVSIGFLAAGRWVFNLLGISISDFKIAGGILLFIIAIVDLIFPERTRTFPKETLGVVPIGIPLITGPAVLTLLLMIVPTLWLCGHNRLSRLQLADRMARLQSIPMDHATAERRG